MGNFRERVRVSGGTAVLAIGATVMVYVAGSLILGVPWIAAPIVFLFFFFCLSVTRRDR